MKKKKRKKTELVRAVEFGLEFGEFEKGWDCLARLDLIAQNPFVQFPRTLEKTSGYSTGSKNQGLI